MLFELGPIVQTILVRRLSAVFIFIFIFVFIFLATDPPCGACSKGFVPSSIAPTGGRYIQMKINRNTEMKTKMKMKTGL